MGLSFGEKLEWVNSSNLGNCPAFSFISASKTPQSWLWYLAFSSFLSHSLDSRMLLTTVKTTLPFLLSQRLELPVCVSCSKHQP